VTAGFHRRLRLTHKAEFDAVFARAFRSRDACFTVLARRNELEHPRLGLAISRKIARSSVARNRLKRLIRESFRHAQGRLSGIDLVVMGRPGIAGLANGELFNSLEQHWNRLVKRSAPQR